MNVVRLVVGTTGGLRGTPLSPRFLLFPDGLLPIFDAVEFHGGKRDTNCARLVKDQPPPSPSFKKRLRSYSTQAQGQQPFTFHRFGHFSRMTYARMKEGKKIFVWKIIFYLSAPRHVSRVASLLSFYIHFPYTTLGGLAHSDTFFFFFLINLPRLEFGQ